MGCGASSGAGSERDSSTHDDASVRGRGLSAIFSGGQKNQEQRMVGYGIVTPLTLSRPPATEIPKSFRELLDEHARFLVNFIAILERSSGGETENKKQMMKLPLRPMQRPSNMETFAVKSHWMDNVRARKMCDEMLHLEDTKHPLPDAGGPKNGPRSNNTFMRTVQLGLGRQVNVLKMSNNPEVRIGGYFIISQMLSYIKALVSLDLSSNNLTAAEARVLSLGLRSNHSVQELRMKDNMIGSEGATSMADMLKVNDSLILLDLRMNCIRGAGVCVLADAVSENKSLTDLDMRWNYAGECSDFVEMALVDLKDFCFRNMMFALESQRVNKPTTPERVSSNDANIIVKNPDSPELTPTKAPQEPPIPIPVDFFGDQEPIGRLEVTIISARNLPQVIWTSGKDGEFMGLPQAYCTFTLNKQSTSTGVLSCVGISRKLWACNGIICCRLTPYMPMSYGSYCIHLIFVHSIRLFTRVMSLVDE